MNDTVFNHRAYHIILPLYIFFLCIGFLTGHTTLAYSQEPKQNFLSRFDDQNTLLLRPKVGQVFYEDDIFTILQQGDLYLSIEDFIAVLNLAIDFDNQNQTARGWFLRTDWKINIDLNAGIITSRGQNFTAVQKDIIQQDNIYFVRLNQIEEWFNFQLIPDIPQQYIEIITPYPLPAVASLNRQNKRKSNNRRNEAQLPRFKQEREWLDFNTADIQLGTRIQRQGRQNKETSIRNSSVVALQGQALKHDAYLLGSYNNQDGLASITGNLSLRDEDAVLLGPLHARQYTLGDTAIPNIPLLGSTTQEFGARITNNRLTTSQFQTTTLDGQAFPGWDVELYRNNILIDVKTVDNTGQYEFNDIQLFGGDNNFEIFFYGPQGEIEKKEISVPVTSAILNAQNNFYDVAISATHSQLYKKSDLRRDDDRNLHITAQYNKQIANGFGYIGYRQRTKNEEDTPYLGAGYTGSYGANIIDANIGANLEGALSGQLRLRRALSGWDLITTAKVQSENYTPDSEERASQFQLTTSTQKAFKPTDDSRLNIFSRGNLNVFTADEAQSSTQLGLTYQKNNISVSNNLDYNYTSFKDSPSFKTLKNNLTARYNKDSYFLRGGMSTTLYPERDIDSYYAQLTHRPHNKISYDLRLTHRPIQDETQGRLNLNYTGKYFRTSPFIEYDSNQDLFAGVNVNFSLVDTPEKDDLFDITSRRLAGKGLVSSFVYHDKNGNYQYDEGDEHLPDVVVESINVRRRQLTNKNGHALITDLPVNRATDIHVDQDTLPDSFMISANEGVSILPNPGEIVELTFPIHLAGEIDGTVSLMHGDNTNPIRRAGIELYPVSEWSNKVISITTALDGFYVGSEIPPGRYLMKIDDYTAKKYKAGAPAPQLIEIGFNGDVLYGLDLTLDSDKPHVPVKITRQENGSDLNDLSATSQRIALKTENVAQSRLASLLGQYALKQADPDILGPSQDNILLRDASLNQASSALDNDTIQAKHQRCLELLSNAIPCAMEIIIPNSR